MSNPVKEHAGKITVAAFALFLVFGYNFFVGSNDNQNYQIRQAPNGDMTIQDRGGIYIKFWEKIWTNPKVATLIFEGPEYADATSQKGEQLKCLGESIRVTFNDGGSACIDVFAKVRLPSSDEKRLKLHRETGSDMDKFNSMILANIKRVAKATAPMMSASEHQSARKSEFNDLVETQVQNGMFKMQKFKRASKDQFDEKGTPITIYVTELVLDDSGMPIIVKRSPLKVYDIQVVQLDIGEVDYDKKTLKAFSTKKESFLKAETSKSQRETEVQERLTIVEKGKKEKAQVEADANKALAKATIEAEQKVMVEEQLKLQEETKARKKLEVAKINKLEAETLAQQHLAVAKLGALAAIEEAKSIRILAKAEEDRIKKAGAITERERVLAVIAADARIKVARELAKIKVPSVVMSGGSNGGGGLTESMFNLGLMKQLGIIDLGTTKTTTTKKK